MSKGPNSAEIERGKSWAQAISFAKGFIVSVDRYCHYVSLWYEGEGFEKVVECGAISVAKEKPAYVGCVNVSTGDRHILNYLNEAIFKTLAQANAIQKAEQGGIYRCSNDSQTAYAIKGEGIPACSCGKGRWEFHPEDNRVKNANC